MAAGIDPYAGAVTPQALPLGICPGGEPGNRAHPGYRHRSRCPHRDVESPGPETKQDRGSPERSSG